MPDWTIRSETEPKYVVYVPDVERDHAESVLKDLIENKWTPSDLLLEPVKRKRSLWRRRG